MSTEEVVRAYLQALEDGEAAVLIELLGPQPRFVSPFSVWSTPKSVAAACAARTRAFHSVAGVGTQTNNGEGFIRWRGFVDEREVEGVDVLAVAVDGVSSIDVFLRPADILEAVYAAMAAAWPSRPSQ